MVTGFFIVKNHNYDYRCLNQRLKIYNTKNFEKKSEKTP